MKLKNLLFVMLIIGILILPSFAADENWKIMFAKDPHHFLPAVGTEISDYSYLFARDYAKKQGILDGKHTLFIESFATFIFHGVEDAKEIEVAINNGKSGDLNALKLVTPRWKKKIKEMIENPPFKDQEVFEHLKKVENDMKDALLFLKSKTQKPFGLWLYGSIMQGYFRPFSDLDVKISSYDYNFIKIATTESRFGHNTNDGKTVGFVRKVYPNFLKVFGRLLAIDDGSEFVEQPDFLKNVYVRILSEKGLTVNTDENGKVSVKFCEGYEKIARKRLVSKIFEKLYATAYDFKMKIIRKTRKNVKLDCPPVPEKPVNEETELIELINNGEIKELLLYHSLHGTAKDSDIAKQLLQEFYQK